VRGLPGRACSVREAFHFCTSQELNAAKGAEGAEISQITPGFYMFLCETPRPSASSAVLLFAAFDELARNLRRQVAKNLLRDFPIFGRHDVLTLRETIRREHFVTQLAETSARPAIAALAARATWAAAQEIRCHSKGRHNG